MWNSVLRVLASKACRRAVMFGTSLDLDEVGRRPALRSLQRFLDGGDETEAVALADAQLAKWADDTSVEADEIRATATRVLERVMRPGGAFAHGLKRNFDSMATAIVRAK